jgi:DNA (cytosine-5)-methyltransferase 1
LLENVKGLLSHDHGRTFKTIIATLTDVGYDLQWQVLNSKNFGVPQNRERVFITGNLRGTTRPEVFPVRKNDSIPNDENETNIGRPQAEVSGTIRAKGNIDADQTFIIHNVYGGFGEKEVREFHKTAPTIRTPQGGGHIPNLVTGTRIRRLTPRECERLQGFPDDWTKEGTDYNYGIDGQVTGGNFIPMSDTQRYKMCGNAVTVNVVKWVAERLLKTE